MWGQPKAAPIIDMDSTRIWHGLKPMLLIKGAIGFPCNKMMPYWGRRIMKKWWLKRLTQKDGGDYIVVLSVTPMIRCNMMPCCACKVTNASALAWLTGLLKWHSMEPLLVEKYQSSFQFSVKICKNLSNDYQTNYIKMILKSN